MKKIKLLLLSTLLASACLAQVPKTISFQGFLTNATNDPVTGNFEMTFTIFDTETGPASSGPFLWQELKPSVTVTEGLYSVILGDITTLNLPFDKTYYLQVKVGTETLTPRFRITSSAYSLSSTNASTITSGSLSGALVGPGINAANLSGEINNARLDSDLQDLADGSLSGSLVGTGIDAANVTTGQLDNARLDADLQDLADGTLSGTKLGITAGANIVITPSANSIEISTGGSALSGAGSNGRISFWNGPGSFSSDASLVWDNTGKAMGIGVASPVEKLEVNGTVKATGFTGSGANLTALPAASLTGTLSVSQGGTGASTLTGAIFGNGTGSLTGVSSSAASQYLRRNSSNSAYEFGALIVTGAEITNASIGSADLANGSVSGGAGGVITDGSITSSDLASGSVSGGASGVITDASITSADLANGSVSGGAGGVITDATITASDLAAGSVSGGAAGVITDASITSADLANSSVSGGAGGVITDASITSADLAAGSVSGGAGGAISDNTITAADLADGSVSGGSGGELTDGTIVNADVSASAAIAGSKISPAFGAQNVTTTGTGYVGATGGVHVGSTTAPATAGNLEVDGFTKLGTGASAPAIKMLYLTGTTNSSASGSTNVNHGLTAAKILSVNVLVEYAANNLVPPGFENSFGYYYNVSVTSSQVVVTNVDKSVAGFVGVFPSTSSANIRSVPFRILIIYEQ